MAEAYAYKPGAGVSYLHPELEERVAEDTGTGGGGEQLGRRREMPKKNVKRPLKLDEWFKLGELEASGKEGIIEQIGSDAPRINNEAIREAHAVTQQDAATVVNQAITTNSYILGQLEWETLSWANDYVHGFAARELDPLDPQPPDTKTERLAKTAEDMWLHGFVTEAARRAKRMGLVR